MATTATNRHSESAVLDAIDELMAAGLDADGVPLDDYTANRYPACPHCGRDWHGLPQDFCPGSLAEDGLNDLMANQQIVLSERVRADLLTATREPLTMTAWTCIEAFCSSRGCTLLSTWEYFQCRD